MTKTEKTALNKLIAKAELLTIHPIAFLAKVEGRPPDANEPVRLAVNTELAPTLTDVGFDFVLQVTVTAQVEGRNEAPFVRFIYSVVAKYKVARELCDAESTRLAYAEHVTLVQAWPFVRHFVQSSCAELAIPIVLLPIMQAGAIKLAVRQPDATAGPNSTPRI